MPAPLRIGLLLFPGCMPAGLLAFADLLRAANRRAGRAVFDTGFVALRAGPVDCGHGVTLHAPDALARGAFDAILIAGAWADSAAEMDAMLMRRAPLVAALSALPRTVALWSYCTGVAVLAATGRLRRQQATATFWLADALRQRHRTVQWQTERTCILAPRHATASGVGGYLPIAEALIERHAGHDVARDITRLMVLPRPATPHPAFKATARIEQPDGLLRTLHALVEQLPAERITVAALAERLGLSERTLARRVADGVGTSVAAHARRIKLGQVGERLTRTSMPLGRIADELGFSSDANLRRMFKQLTGLTPATYRQRFGRI